MTATKTQAASSFPERLQERLIDFSVAVWESAQSLPQHPSVARLGDQLIRSVTSVAANYAEARGAESRRDFIHKMQICLKELRETNVWLEIVRRIAGPSWLPPLAKEGDELVRVFVTSIKTARGVR